MRARDSYSGTKAAVDLRSSPRELAGLVETAPPNKGRGDGVQTVGDFKILDNPIEPNVPVNSLSVKYPSCRIALVSSSKHFLMLELYADTEPRRRSQKVAEPVSVVERRYERLIIPFHTLEPDIGAESRLGESEVRIRSHLFAGKCLDEQLGVSRSWQEYDLPGDFRTS